MYFKKDVLENFAKSTEKHLHQSLFFNNFMLQLYYIVESGVSLWIL